MTTTTNEYWLGVGATEVEHLVAQADVYAPEAEALLDRVDLPAGASAIDVGCGVLGILPQRVAASARPGASSVSTSRHGCRRRRGG